MREKKKSEIFLLTYLLATLIKLTLFYHLLVVTKQRHKIAENKSSHVSRRKVVEIDRQVIEAQIEFLIQVIAFIVKILQLVVVMIC